MYKEAIAAMTKARTITGGVPDLESELGYAYAASGRKAQALKMANGLKKQAPREYVNPYLIARVCKLRRTRIVAPGLRVQAEIRFL